MKFIIKALSATHLNRTVLLKGVTERKNRTIVEMVRNMPLEKGMLKKFWADAVACASYVLNRCLTKSVLKKTSEEA